MMAYATPNEKFVDIRGIIEIRWVSDDPDFYCRPVDLFDEMAKGQGLDESYGKKDKQTTEQAFFTCNVCECDLKSVITLRAHCKGTSHLKRALQKKQELKRAAGNVKKEEVKVEQEEPWDLFEALERTSEPVVGLEFITEYVLENSRGVKPYYHCKLEYCSDAQGDASYMSEHLLKMLHKENWLYFKTGESCEVHDQVHTKIQKFQKDYKRDYRQIQQVSDPHLYSKCQRGRIRVNQESSTSDEFRTRHRSSSRSRYRRRSRSRTRKRSRSRHRSKSRKRQRSRSRSRQRSRSPRSSLNTGTNGCDGNSLSRRAVPPGKREQMTAYGERQHELESSLPVVSQNFSNQRVKREIAPNEEEVQVLSEKGSFNFQDTSSLPSLPKHDVDTTQPSDMLQQSSGAFQNAFVSGRPELNTEEQISKLHKDVAKAVKCCLDIYYPHSIKFQPGQEKIGSVEQYRTLAKKFSHELRMKIKQSYEDYHRCLDGIQLTSDNYQFIKVEIDSHMELLPHLRRK